jgi:ribosome-associated toxin RatA of RatAB toxin-antitoxin module
MDIVRQSAMKLPWLLVVSSIFACTVRADDPSIRVQAHREGEAIVLDATASLRASIRQAWRVITDYERYPLFVPDLTVSHVVSRRGNTVILEQQGEAGFVFFHYPIHVRLEVTEQPSQRVIARALQGNFRRMDGLYELREEAATLRFVYRGRLVPDFHLPPLVGLPAVRTATERQFSALVREINRRSEQERGAK